MLRSLGRHGVAAAALLALAAPQVLAAQVARQSSPPRPRLALPPGVTSVARQVETRTFQPALYGPVCPKQLLAGDREFGGAGPEVWLTAEARVTADEAVELTLTMRARETRADWSETVGTWTRRLTPPEMKVKRILSATRSEASFVSAMGGAQIAMPLTTDRATAVRPDVGALVDMFFVVGDTGGPDISDDDNCKDDTSVSLRFSPLQLEVYR